jgi:uncharacterized membrane protein YgdD (TMEM256/DUF423 family)
MRLSNSTLAGLATRIALLSGAAAVGLAAWGAHALTGAEASGLRAFDTAARMHLIHSVVLLVIALWWSHAPRSRSLGLACAMLILGMLMFCGTIYLRVLAGETSLARLAPAGGLLLIAGWITPVFAGHWLKGPKTDEDLSPGSARFGE